MRIHRSSSRYLIKTLLQIHWKIFRVSFCNKIIAKTSKFTLCSNFDPLSSLQSNTVWVRREWSSSELVCLPTPRRTVQHQYIHKMTASQAPIFCLPAREALMSCIITIVIAGAQYRDRIMIGKDKVYKTKWWNNIANHSFASLSTSSSPTWQ